MPTAPDLGGGMQWETMSDRERDALVAEHLFEMVRYIEPPRTEPPDWVRSLTSVVTIDMSGGKPNPSWTTREGERLYLSAVWPIHTTETILRYTTDHNAAAQVRNEIARRGLMRGFVYHLLDQEDLLGDMRLELKPYPLEDAYEALPFDALVFLLNASPEQQCRAALRAVGVEV